MLDGSFDSKTMEIVNSEKNIQAGISGQLELLEGELI